MKTPDMKIIEKTIANLQRNNMLGFYCETKEEALKKVLELIEEGDTVTNGGSETLKQVGVIDAVKNGNYNYVDRSLAESKEEAEELMREAYFADVYLTSSNAVTQYGELYNVDGNSNRVSAILYGPKSVVVVCGYNKIVKNFDEAVYRVKTKAAPPNTQRLHTGAYCEHAGECLSVGRDGSFMCDGCRGEGRICCNYVVCAQQRHKDRIKVIIVGESLGY